MQLNYSNIINYYPALNEDIESGIECVKDVIGLDRGITGFIEKYASKEGAATILRATTYHNIDAIENTYQSIINLQQINDIDNINNFLVSVNKKLPDNGIFISSVETDNQLKSKIYNKYPRFFAGIFWVLIYFYNWLFSLPADRFKMHPGKNDVLPVIKSRCKIISKAETFGRLVLNGFEIVDFKETENFLYFVSRKIKEPFLYKNTSYGLLFKMKRVGKEGKFITVHKLRTMYPYAEYLQEYVYKLNKLDETGKFKDDFRITFWGKFIRRWWIDELPMIINWFKGDVKLVGLRPLSPHYLSLYSEEFKERRLKYKPGLIPPYYVDLPKTLDGIIESEEKYLNSFEENPFLTDLKYFIKVFYNIIFKHVRSK